MSRCPRSPAARLGDGERGPDHPTSTSASAAPSTRASSSATSTATWRLAGLRRAGARLSPIHDGYRRAYAVELPTVPHLRGPLLTSCRKRCWLRARRRPRYRLSADKAPASNPRLADDEPGGMDSWDARGGTCGDVDGACPPPDVRATTAPSRSLDGLRQSWPSRTGQPSYSGLAHAVRPTAGRRAYCPTDSSRTWPSASRAVAAQRVDLREPAWWKRYRVAPRQLWWDGTATASSSAAA